MLPPGPSPNSASTLLPLTGLPSFENPRGSTAPPGFVCWLPTVCFRWRYQGGCVRPVVVVSESDQPYRRIRRVVDRSPDDFILQRLVARRRFAVSREGEWSPQVRERRRGDGHRLRCARLTANIEWRDPGRRPSGTGTSSAQFPGGNRSEVTKAELNYI